MALKQGSSRGVQAVCEEGTPAISNSEIRNPNQTRDSKQVGNPNSETALPKVAIVVVNYRTADLTIDCVRSLQNLRYDELDIIVVENCSGDDSAVRFLQEFPPLTRGGRGGDRAPRGVTYPQQLRHVTLLVAAENGGYTAGNNLGIEHALASGANFILVLNPDTVVINPDFLTTLVGHMVENPNVGAVGPRVFLRESGNVQNTVLRFPWVWRRIADWFRHCLRKPAPRSGALPIAAEVLNGVCVLLRADCLREVGLFDERTFAYIEDVEWSYRAQRAGYSRQYLPVDSIIHLQKDTGYERGGTVDFLLKRNTLYFLLKTHHRLQAIVYTLCTLTLAGMMIAKSTFSGRAAKNARFARRLARAYAGLWLGRTDSVMGFPL